MQQAFSSESLFILALALFLGFELLSRIPETLHAHILLLCCGLAGVLVIGAAMFIRSDNSGSLAGAMLGFVSVVLASAAVVGGCRSALRALDILKAGAGEKAEGPKS